MPIYQFVCMAHGKFDKIMPVDSTIPKCPQGCSAKMVQKIIGAPAILSKRTKSIDRTLQGLADDHGLTDMNNQNGTSSVMRPDAKFNKAQDNLQRQMLSGQTWAGDMATGDNAITQTMNSGGFVADNAIESVKPLLGKPKVIVEASWDGKK